MSRLSGIIFLGTPTNPNQSSPSTVAADDDDEEKPLDVSQRIQKKINLFSSLPTIRLGQSNLARLFSLVGFDLVFYGRIMGRQEDTFPRTDVQRYLP